MGHLEFKEADQECRLDGLPSNMSKGEVGQVGEKCQDRRVHASGTWDYCQDPGSQFGLGLMDPWAITEN